MDRFNDVNVCTMRYAVAWWVLLVAPKGVILLGCCYLAYQVRNLPSNFNGEFTRQAACAVLVQC